MTKKIITFCLILFTFIGCKKADELTQFNIEFNETAVIPSSTGINLPFNIFTPDVETNSTSTFEVNDTRKDLIEEITLTSLGLKITTPNNADFSFLKSISIYISADGLSESKIAWRNNVPSDAKELKLDLTGIDLKEYIKKDSYSLRLNTVTDEAMSQDHEIDVKSTFFVDAKILGL